MNDAIISNGKYDVAVCGGGFAGISAALAAARQGKKVVLFEKLYMLGGLGTAGLIAIYLPLCDGYGRQISYGIAEELLKMSVSYGADGIYAENWLDGKGTRTEKDKRYTVQYNPQLFAILAEKKLIDAGVDILYGSYVVDVEKKNDKIESVIVENKSGRLHYYIKSVVDATGDCDIVKFANVPTETFKQGNILAAWYYFADNGGYHLKQQGPADIPDEEKKNMAAPKLLLNKRFSGLDADELSEIVYHTHQQILNNWVKKRKNDASSQIATIPTTPLIRMTRKIVGEYTLKYNEEHKYMEDSIGMVPNWRRRGPVYEVPFGTLYNRSVKNLIVAGRCTSVDETMWDLMRVIPCCAVTGQAAGTAAAMSDDFTTLDIKELQARLTKDFVKLHEQDLIKL